MRTILSGLAALFAFFVVTAAPAAAESINCPLSQATRTISNGLPSGWWTTPIQSTLSSTRVQNIGGTPALMCIYGDSGSIQRNAPEHSTCTARTGGFECTSTASLIPVPLPTPIPGVIVTPRELTSGPLNVPQSFRFDLDQRRVGAASADLWFHAVSDSEQYLEPVGGATMAVGDRSNRGYAGCSTASYSSTRVNLNDLPRGSHVCVRTSEGHTSQFRVNGYTTRGPRALILGVTTWN